VKLVPGRYGRVLQPRPVRILLSGYGVSLVGDGMSVVSVAALALRIGACPHRSLIVGASLAAYSLPAALGALVLRRWLSAVSSRRLVLLDCLLRALAMAAIPIVRVAGGLNPGLYIGLLAIGSLLMSWGYAGRYSLIAELAEPDLRMAANSLMSSLDSLSVVVGPALAGAIITFADPSVLIAADAASYVALAVAVGRLPDPIAHTDAPDPGQGGWTLLRRNPQLLALLVITFGFYFLYGPVEVALPVFVADHHTVSVLGLYWAVFGLGALVGGLAAGTLPRLRLWTTMVGVIAGWGLAVTVFGITSALAPTLIAFAVGGAIYGPYPALSFTLFQDETPKAQLTAVLAARSGILVASSPLGTVLGGPLTAGLGASGTLFLSGITTVGLAVVALPLVRRNRDAGPVRPPVGPEGAGPTAE
jgi:predicted MFS family arabinose efflux permease